MEIIAYIIVGWFLWSLFFGGGSGENKRSSSTRPEGRERSPGGRGEMPSRADRGGGERPPMRDRPAGGESPPMRDRPSMGGERQPMRDRPPMGGDGPPRRPR